MNTEQYLIESANTQASPRPALLRSTDFTMDLTHVAFGLTTEVGEFTDTLKKHLFYGKELDLTNLMEELGDIEWYMAYAYRTLGLNPDEVKQKNIDKLKARYPQKFSEERAINRNIFVEREILEGGV